MVRLTAIQLTSVPDVNQNLDAIKRQLDGLTPYDNHIVVLPECCLYFGGRDKDQLKLAKENNKRPTHIVAWRPHLSARKPKNKPLRAMKSIGA